MVVQQRWRAECLMLRAVRSGDLASLVALLDSGLDCDQRFSIGGCSRPALCVAVEQGHTAIVSELCRRRCSLSVTDQGGLSPLQLAASLGLTEILQVLLANRAELESPTWPGGETALHLATAGSHHHTVRVLLELGARVDRRDSLGRTSLMLAAHQGSLHTVQTLLSFGARRDLRDSGGNTALLLHCTSPQVNPSLLDLLAGPGLTDLPNREGSWPLLLLLLSSAPPHHNTEEAVRCLLARGADVNLTSSQGPRVSLLQAALSRRRWGVCRLLVRAGARVTTESLYLALLSGNTELAHIFLAAGAPCSLNSLQR